LASVLRNPNDETHQRFVAREFKRDELDAVIDIVCIVFPCSSAKVRGFTVYSIYLTMYV